MKEPDKVKSSRTSRLGPITFNNPLKKHSETTGFLIANTYQTHPLTQNSWKFCPKWSKNPTEMTRWSSPVQCPCLLLDSFSLERGLKLSTPIISAGSFGHSCDHTRNLQRLLPPARKLTDFFIEFWKHSDGIKPPWETAYVYKKQINSDECFWSVAPLTHILFDEENTNQWIHPSEHLYKYAGVGTVNTITGLWHQSENK